MATPRLILVLVAHALLFPAEASSQFRAHASNQSAGISLALQATSPLLDTLGRAVQRFQDPTPPCKDAVPYAVPCDSYNVAGFLLSIIGNIFPAKTTDVFPTIFGVPTFLSLSPDFAFYKLKEGGDIVLPSRLRGIYWFDGLGDPSLSVSTGAADFDAQTRVISSPITDNRWSWTGDNSTWQGLSWSVSGSAVFNGALFPHFGYRVYFNEDYTFGQIVVTIRVVYVTVEIPVPVWDFRMYWQGNDEWRRKSYFLIWDLPSGDYYLRRIINGDGSKGPWYDKGWLTYRTHYRLLSDNKSSHSNKARTSGRKVPWQERQTKSLDWYINAAPSSGLVCKLPLNYWRVPLISGRVPTVSWKVSPMPPWPHVD